MTAKQTGNTKYDQILAGRKPVLEQLQEQPEMVDHVFLQQGVRSPAVGRLMDACKRSKVRYSIVPKAKLDALFDGNHQGVAATLFCQGFVELETLLDLVRQAPLPLALALDQVQDTGNVGTLVRSLYALGGGGLIIPKHNTAHLGAAADRASAGALSRTPVSRVPNLARALEAASESGFAIYAAQIAADSIGLYDWTPALPAILVLGSEEKGIRPGVAKRCDASIHIPLARDFDSLNVAQAGAILLAKCAAHAARG